MLDARPANPLPIGYAKTAVRVKKKQTNKPNPKRAFAQLKGLYVKWSDVDPLGAAPPTDMGRVGHRNPTYRLIASQIFKTYGNWIVHHQRMRWRMDARLVFRHADGDEYVDLSAESMATIDELNQFVLPEIETAMKEAQAAGYWDSYQHTEFIVLCLGHN